MTWQEAENLAASFGGHLASIGSAEENAFVSRFIIEQQQLVLDQTWIGLSDPASQRDVHMVRRRICVVHQLGRRGPDGIA